MYGTELALSPATTKSTTIQCYPAFSFTWFVLRPSGTVWGRCPCRATQHRHHVPVQFELLAGYRVVRKLGIGARAEVFLGLPSAHASRSPDLAVALKLFRAGTSTDSMDTEVAALSRVEHPHLLRLKDLASTANGRPCLVLERLGRGSLAYMLESRDAVSPGEAVSLLAPIAAAVSAMHADGVAHGAIRPHAVLFRPSGAPVLAGFGHAALIHAGATIAALADEPAVGEDYRSLNRLAGAVLERVEGDKSARLARWLDHISATGYPDMFADVLGERVFELGEPEPVLSDGMARPGAPTIPARIPLGSIPHPRVTASTVNSLLDRLPIPPLARSVIDRVLSIRKPKWLVAGAVAVALTVVMLIVIPSSPSDPATVTADSSIPSPVATDPTKGGNGAVDIDAVTGEDPIAALDILLETRARCIRDLSVLCLDAAVQDGSAAMDDDIAAIRSLQNGGEAPESNPVRAGSIVERNGDAALVTVGGQAGQVQAADEVLMIKGHSGWRIRAYIPSEAAKSPDSSLFLTATRNRAASAPSTIRWS
jgi:eukaryotic-like serine/threonine-protein kinase